MAPGRAFDAPVRNCALRDPRRRASARRGICWYFDPRDSRSSRPSPESGTTPRPQAQAEILGLPTPPPNGEWMASLPLLMRAPLASWRTDRARRQDSVLTEAAPGRCLRCARRVLAIVPSMGSSRGSTAWRMRLPTSPNPMSCAKRGHWAILSRCRFGHRLTLPSSSPWM